MFVNLNQNRLSDCHFAPLKHAFSFTRVKIKKQLILAIFTENLQVALSRRWEMFETFRFLSMPKFQRKNHIENRYFIIILVFF